MVEHSLDVGRARGSSPLPRTNKMIILGIETSCDETALSLLETKEEVGIFKYRILANIVHSQIDMHKEYGGVYPNLAKREHIKNLPVIFNKIIKEANIEEKDISSIVVTSGPGLEPALWTGINFAQELGKKIGVQIIPANHMEGHIVSVLFSNTKPSGDFKELKVIKFPALAILISGGHTEIVKVKRIGEYEVLGRTRDDALGEAFDKTARMLGLPYPGGPEIAKLALLNSKKDKSISLPRPMLNSNDLDFSFSGLKTSILYLIKKKEELTEDDKREIAEEFQDAVTEVLIKKTGKALDGDEYKSIIVGGGVIANSHIRKAFEDLSSEYSIPLYLPEKNLTGDNALMIALAGILSPKTKDPQSIEALGNLLLG